MELWLRRLLGEDDWRDNCYGEFLFKRIRILVTFGYFSALDDDGTRLSRYHKIKKKYLYGYCMKMTLI